MTLKEMEETGYFGEEITGNSAFNDAKLAVDKGDLSEEQAVNNVLDTLIEALKNDSTGELKDDIKDFGALNKAIQAREGSFKSQPMAVGAEGSLTRIPDIKDIEKAIGLKEGTIFEYNDKYHPNWLDMNTKYLKKSIEDNFGEGMFSPVLNALREGQAQRDRSIQMEGYDPVKYKQESSMLSNIGTDIPGYLSSSLMGILAPRSKEGIITKGEASDKDIGLDVAANALSVVPLGAVAARIRPIARALSSRPGLFKFVKSGLDATSAPLGEEILDANIYNDEDNAARSGFNLSDVAIGAGVNIGAPKLVKSGIERVTGAAAGLGQSQGGKVARGLSELIDDPVAQNLDILARSRRNVSKGGTPKGTASGLFNPERYVSDQEYQKSLDALLLNEMKDKGYFKNATDPKTVKNLQKVYNTKYPLDKGSRAESLKKIEGSKINDVSQTERFISGVQDRPLEQLAAYKDLSKLKSKLKKDPNLKELGDVDLKLMEDYGLTPEGKIGKRQPTWDADLSDEARLEKVRAFENRWGFDPTLRAIDPESSALALSKKANDYTDDEYYNLLKGGGYLKPSDFSVALENALTSDPDLARIVRYGSGAGNTAKDLVRLGIVSGLTNKIGKQFDFSFIPGMDEVIKYNQEQLDKKLKEQHDKKIEKHNEALKKNK